MTAKANSSRAIAISRVAPPVDPDQKIYGLCPLYRNGLLVGWAMAIARQGKTIQRSFSASTNGGPDGAKAAALAYRNEVLQQTRPMSKREFNAICRSTNTSGVSGVSRITKGANAYWATGVGLPDGRKQYRAFPVKKHGEEQARALAITARAAMLQTVDGWMTKHPDCAVPKHQTVPELDSVVVQRTKDRPSVKPEFRAPMVGVYPVTQRRKIGAGQVRTTEYWSAECVTSDGRVRRQLFSVSRHGEEQAKSMAMAQRKQWTEHPPEPARRIQQHLQGDGYTVRINESRQVESASQGKVFLYWTVSINWTDGRRQSKSFAKAEFGNDEAKQMALALQARWLTAPP